MTPLYGHCSWRKGQEVSDTDNRTPKIAKMMIPCLVRPNQTSPSWRHLRSPTRRPYQILQTLADLISPSTLSNPFNILNNALQPSPTPRSSVPHSLVPTHQDVHYTHLNALSNSEVGDLSGLLTKPSNQHRTTNRKQRVALWGSPVNLPITLFSHFSLCQMKSMSFIM